MKRVVTAIALVFIGAWVAKKVVDSKPWLKPEKPEARR